MSIAAKLHESIKRRQHRKLNLTDMSCALYADWGLSLDVSIIRTAVSILIHSGLIQQS